uniref:Rhodanase C-terminal domain-containing protein n=1 Tax=Myripristis murdjan TaxID=586833 RepID=A0A667WT02_9TELE
MWSHSLCLALKVETSCHFVVTLFLPGSDCRYCGAPWDQYQLRSTHFCCQLVLSCPVCRQDGRTACCPTCQTKGRAQSDESTPAPPHREECECTVQHPRIPMTLAATRRSLPVLE